MSTVERARGRWREILPQLGIETRFLTNRHGPCPLCGGKDRFRFDDKGGSGSYFCNQCGAGVGLILVRKLRGWDFKTAVAEIDRIIGSRPVTSAPKTKTSDVGARRRARIKRLLSDARDPQVVMDWLAFRGIKAASRELFGHSRCPYYTDGGELVGHYPAVIAPILGPNGELQSAQRIYLAGPEPRKKTCPQVDTISGCAVRLHTATFTLGLAEGIATGLSAHVLFKVPVWAALSENGVKSFVPPAEIQRLLIFADNDRNYVGQDAAYALARRLSRDRPDMSVEVHMPTVAGHDFNDVLNETRS